jgi:endonuclease/exonuclease/phosphatase family metal-dependent hydrolase
MTALESGSFLPEPFQLEWPDTLRIVSWNINRGLRVDEVISFLAESAADLILLQEVDLNARRTGYRNIARDIAQALQMNYVFGCEFEELGQRNHASPAFHGQATLSRLPLSDTQILRFCRQSSFWHPRWFIPTWQFLQRRLGGRMALVSKVAAQGRTLHVYNAHLESRGSDELRCTQLLEIMTHMQECSAKTPVLIAGDFNFDLSSGSAAVLVNSMRLDNPFANLEGRPTAVLRRRGRSASIDWILTHNAPAATKTDIHDTVEASDHYPLSLQICWR